MVEYEDVGVEVLAREYGIFAESKVGVTSCLSRSSAWPVLYHTVDAHSAPAVFDHILSVRGLESVYICSCHVRCKSRVLRETSDASSPARLCVYVSLWRKCSGDTQCAILCLNGLCEVSCHFRVESGSKSQRSRPEGYIPT